MLPGYEGAAVVEGALATLKTLIDLCGVSVTRFPMGFLLEEKKKAVKQTEYFRNKYLSIV